MKNLNFFQLSASGVIFRFYLMMTIVIAAGFTGYWLLGFLALPIFLSIMLGVKINWNAKFEKSNPSKDFILKPNPQKGFSKVA